MPLKNATKKAFASLYAFNLSFQDSVCITDYMSCAPGIVSMKHDPQLVYCQSCDEWESRGLSKVVHSTFLRKSARAHIASDGHLDYVKALADLEEEQTSRHQQLTPTHTQAAAVDPHVDSQFESRIHHPIPAMYSGGSGTCSKHSHATNPTNTNGTSTNIDLNSLRTAENINGGAPEDLPSARATDGPHPFADNSAQGSNWIWAKDAAFERERLQLQAEQLAEEAEHLDTFGPPDRDDIDLEPNVSHFFTSLGVCVTGV